MGRAMAQSHNFVIADPARSLAELLDEAATAFRNRGHTREHAVTQAALALGVKPNRAKGVLYGRIFSIAADEYRAARARFVEHLDDETAHLAERLAATQARRRQMELDLE